MAITTQFFYKTQIHHSLSVYKSAYKNNNFSRKIKCKVFYTDLLPWLFILHNAD